MLPIIKIIFCVTILLFNTQTTIADENGFDENGSSLFSDEKIKGIVVDQTITVVGQYFYKQFTVYWRDVAADIESNITIKERPSARWGSQVMVTANQDLVFRAFIPPARSNIDSTAKRAVDETVKRIKQLEFNNRMFLDPDMAVDEI